MISFRQLWIFALVIKAVLAVLLPLSNDEAYYWVWGQLPQLSYYDHPPMVGWLYWLGRWVDFGGSAPRLPGVVLGHFTLLIWNELLRPYLSERQRVGWLAFVLLSPFLGIGSIVITPDTPLLFFWSLATWFFTRSLESKSKKDYLLLGAALGLGFCAKYHMVLFVPVAWVWLLFSGRWREIQYRYLPLTVVTGLIFCTPVWYWNMQNDWVSFRFQLEHGLAGKKWRSTYPLEYVLGQIALLFPPLLILAFQRREPKSASWMHAFAWIPLAFFFYTSFKARVEANWPIIAHPFVLSLAYLNSPGGRWIRITMGTWAVALVLVLSHILHPWFPVDPKKLKTAEFTKFDPLLAEIPNYQPFYAGSYQMAGALSFKQRHVVFKLGGMNRRDFFDFQPMSYPESDVFYVASEPETDFPTWFAEKGYEMTLAKDVTPLLRIYEVKRRAQGSDR